MTPLSPSGLLSFPARSFSNRRSSSPLTVLLSPRRIYPGAASRFRPTSKVMQRTIVDSETLEPGVMIFYITNDDTATLSDPYLKRPWPKSGTILPRRGRARLVPLQGLCLYAGFRCGFLCQFPRCPEVRRTYILVFSLARPFIA